MLKVLLARAKQGYRTGRFPAVPPAMPEKFLGIPEIKPEQCLADCQRCVDACPVKCISKVDGKPVIDLGPCIFCGECAVNCLAGTIRFSRDHRLAVRNREDLLLDGKALKLAAALDKKMLALFGRSLKLRVVSAGGCNACEADVNVLNTLVWDLGRFGIQFVASPRHADGLLVTGPVTANMAAALKKTYDAIARPKLVIAVGACAISGGLFRDLPEAGTGTETVIPVDLYIPGCPPHPATILDGLLRLIDKIAVVTTF